MGAAALLEKKFQEPCYLAHTESRKRIWALPAADDTRLLENAPLLAP